MTKYQYVFSAFIVLLAMTASAQQGYIKGLVTDIQTGETLPGVNVVIPGTTHGTVSDMEGNFTLSLEPGKHELRFSFISFKPVVVGDLNVISGQVTNLGKVSLETDAENLQEVTISATMARNNETAMLTMKKKSANMIDAVSSASFKKTGDSDAATSVKRVPGISVEDGKYIYVRGLSDRYTKTLLNGFEISGLDPDRNTIQMDIFPTGVLDNIIVHKTSMAPLPADFTGGAINISTKDFPEEKQGSISISGGYNPQFHFQNDYLKYKGSKTDFLGFDNGLREIPATQNIPQFAQVVGNPNGIEANRYKDILTRFNPEMAAYQTRSLMDYGIGFNYGNQTVKEKRTIGYNFMLSYKNETSFYKNAEYNRYGLSANPDQNELEIREQQSGSYGTSNVLLSAMAGLAIKTDKSKLKLNLLHLQNGESKAGIFEYVSSNQGAVFKGFQHNLEYSQRSITNFMLLSEHYIPESAWTIEWGISPTLSKLKDPDVRFTRYELRKDKYVIGTEAGFPQRIWRDLNELSVSSRVGAANEFELFGQASKLQFGGSHNYKHRDFNIYNFNVNIRGIELTGNPNEIFADENLWPYGDDHTSGTTIDAVFLPTNPNKFSANVHKTSGYASLDFQPIGLLKAVIGLRFEHYVQRYAGQDQLGANVLNNDKVLESFDLFPSLNLAYTLNENQNLRFSYGKTIARPSLKELSYSEIFDPLTGRTFIGSLFRDANDAEGIEYWAGNLQSTDIHNLDLRWEIFPTLSSTISFGVFYKYFINPIELIQFSTQAGAFQARNVGDGQVMGAEIEMRTGLNFISEKLKDFSWNANFTASQSQIELSNTELESRKANARTGQKIDSSRPMMGQAPFIINAGISYEVSEEGIAKNLRIGLFYNVQSSTLLYVGIVDRPDVFSVAFHSLNINASKDFGKDERMKIAFKMSNILGAERQEVYQSYEANDQIFSRINQGRSFSLGYTYSF